MNKIIKDIEEKKDLNEIGKYLLKIVDQHSINKTEELHFPLIEGDYLNLIENKTLKDFIIEVIKSQ